MFGIPGWFVLAGPFLLYYESPEKQVAHEVIDDSVLFCGCLKTKKNRGLVLYTSMQQKTRYRTIAMTLCRAVFFDICLLPG